MMTGLIHKEIERLKQNILSQVAAVEENLRVSVDALETLDIDLARQVIEADIDIDHAEVDLEEECLKILALFQPVATDLRFIVAVMKINNDLERISDLAVNIAERAEVLVHSPRLQIPFDFTIMTDNVQEMLRMSITSLVDLNARMAYRVCAMDEDVDALNREMYGIVSDMVCMNPQVIEHILHYLSVSRYLERIADHATNIAEDVIYMIEGEIVRHQVKGRGMRHDSSEQSRECDGDD